MTNLLEDMPDCQDELDNFLDNKIRIRTNKIEDLN